MPKKPKNKHQKIKNYVFYSPFLQRGDRGYVPQTRLRGYEQMCLNRGYSYTCTLIKGHVGKHIAHGYKEIVASWETATPLIVRKVFRSSYPGYIPGFLPYNGQCGKTCAGYVCTREKGHTGIHVGHISVGTTKEVTVVHWRGDN